MKKDNISGKIQELEKKERKAEKENRVGILPQRRSVAVAATVVSCLAIAVGGYFLVGFLTDQSMLDQTSNAPLQSYDEGEFSPNASGSAAGADNSQPAGDGTPQGDASQGEPSSTRDSGAMTNYGSGIEPTELDPQISFPDMIDYSFDTAITAASDPAITGNAAPDISAFSEETGTDYEGANVTDGLPNEADPNHNASSPSGDPTISSQPDDGRNTVTTTATASVSTSATSTTTKRTASSSDDEGYHGSIGDVPVQTIDYRGTIGGSLSDYFN